MSKITGWASQAEREAYEQQLANEQWQQRNTGYQIGRGGYSTPPTSTQYRATPTTAGTGGATTTVVGGSNPNSAAAVKYLNRVIKGKELPYDKETQANMLSEQSGMAAAAESARNAEMNQSAVAGGASYNDPSLAAARASSMARRQSDNMGAAREIAQNANVQNQAQQMAAAKALATFGLAESDRQAQAFNQWAGSGYAQSRPTLANGLGQGFTGEMGQTQESVTSPYPAIKPANRLVRQQNQASNTFTGPIYRG